MSLRLITCKTCKKPFQSLGGDICPKCLQQIEDDFMILKDYIYDNPGRHSVDSLHAATKVSRETILHLISEERIVMTAAPAGAGPVCSNCKKPMPEGSGLCQDCKDALSRTFASSAGPVSKPSSKESAADIKASKMHVKERRTK